MTCRAQLTHDRFPLYTLKVAVERERNRTMGVNETMAGASPKRVEKHQEILNASQNLNHALSLLEALARRVIEGDVPTGGAPVRDTMTDAAGDVTLGQFLEAFPQDLLKYTERLEVVRNELQASLF